jgi:uncharacterized protein
MGRPWWPLVVTSGGLLAWGDLVVPALPPTTGVRTAANLGATAVLVLVARSAGLTWAELGMSRSTWRAGLRWGAAALGVATAGYLVALTIPAGHAALARSAVGGLTTGELTLRALVLIPLGTVLCEEVAFRGVLLAVALRHLPVRPASALASLVFGLWHVTGALNSAEPADAPFLVGASVAGTVLVTTLGGAVFTLLRLRSGSLLAPIGLHLGTNTAGLLAAVAASR